MLKLVVLSALLAVAVAKPGALIAPLAYGAPLAVVHQPAYVHGPIVHSAPIVHAPIVHAPTFLSYPSAISSQSSTVVHNKGALVAAWPSHGIVAAPIAVSSW